MIFYDNGVSGVTFERNDFKKVLKLINLDMVETLIVKDMSRPGRNYIKMGELTETILPMHDVRLIDVNDGVKSLSLENQIFISYIVKECRTQRELENTYNISHQNIN